MYGYIYKTTNLINGKLYVGQHRSEVFDTKYLGSGKIIRQALNKYGKENFKCEILEWCASLEELNAREKFWIAEFDAVHSEDFYNIAEGGGGCVLFGENNPMYGKENKHTQEEKDKISHTIKQQYATGERQKYWVGKHHSNETRDKMSKSRLGKKLTRRNLDYKPWNYGVPITDEQKEKLRQSRLGVPLSEDAKQKISEANRGKVRSEETRKRMSEAAKIREQKKRDARNLKS